MEFEANVSYGPGKARYRISRENPGIYHALLLNFEGNENQQPPAEITLIRGVRCWTGSDTDNSLINTLGALIEAYLVKPERQKNRK